MKFREYRTGSGKVVLLGKSSETNETLVEQVDKNEYVLHTAKPGSPFTNIKEDKEEVSNEDLKEAAVFCAKHSQDWRDNKRDVVVHVFLGKDIYKEKDMSEGTFGVKNYKELKVKKEEIEKFENGNKRND